VSDPAFARVDVVELAEADAAADDDARVLYLFLADARGPRRLGRQAGEVAGWPGR
jgi:hypothetical protein